ncbi:MAG: ABC transporter permease [Tepidisphaeraceae bacterium]|jgi:phospholipid/cholesterol/gamma-HCH transport system permease protein
MPGKLIETVGRRTNNLLAEFGQFCDFAGRTFIWLFATGLRWKSLRQLLPQLFEIGVQSIPVIAVTGGFIGMIMAIETYSQFKALGQEDRMGSVIFLSVVKQIGPVLAAVMLAGRVGGALTAELGTMNVTEQLDALRVMGTDPIQFLVVPRFIACLLLTPMLAIYSDITGIVGGWLISVQVLGVPSGPFWHYAAHGGVEMWQVNEGIIKSFFFGGAIGLISCYKGFFCGAGANGVGRACTESFVTSFLCIIIMNFFFAQIAQDWYIGLYGIRSVFGN